MVQKDNSAESIRLKLIGLLPRLRRFAAVLAGDRRGCDALLRAACERMLESAQRYRRGTAFDRWAFAELYGLWLEMLRSHTEPMAQGRGDAALFRTAFAGAGVGEAELADTANILSNLPQQQRSAALLIYGEGFSYEDAAEILDTPSHTAVERATRVLVALVERAGLTESADAGAAHIQTLYPTERQAVQ